MMLIIEWVIDNSFLYIKMSKLTDKFVRESDSPKCVGKIGMFISQTITQNYLTMKKKFAVLIRLVWKISQMKHREWLRI